MTVVPASPSRLGALAPIVPLFAVDVLTAFTVGMVPPLLPLLAGHWSLSPVEAGLVNTAYAVGRLGASYPASCFRARRGTRAAIFAGVAGLVAGTVGCGLAPSFPAFLAARVVMGAGSSAAFLAVFAELLEATPAGWRGRVANAFEATAILSLAAGGVLAATLASVWGWRVVFVGSGPVLLLTLAVWPALGSTAGRQATAAGVAWRAGALRGLVPVFVASFALTATWAGLWTTVAPLLGAGEYGLGSTALGLALGAGYVAEVLGLIGLALVIDRVRREPVFLWGSLSVAAGAGIMAVGASPGLFVAGLVLVGGGFAVWMIPATVLVDRAGAPIPPGTLAAYRIVMDAGMIVGPLLLGGLAQAAGHRVGVGLAGLVLLAGAVVLARR